MAVLPPAPNVISVTLIGTNQGAPWMNKFHMYGASGLTGDAAEQTAMAAFNTSVGTAWGTSIAPICNSQVFLTAVQTIDLSTRSSPALTSTLTTPIPGTHGAPNLPVQVAMCLSWHVPNRYRGGHGRIYVPAGVLADISSGRSWTSTFLASANTAASGFFTALDGLSLGATALDLIVLSYYFGSHRTPGQPPPLPVLRANPERFDVTGAGVRGRVDTQRRRLGKETI